MATKRKPSAQSKSSLLSGMVIGLVIGLILAVAAAFFITKAPIPFMDKVSPHIEDILASGGYGVDETVGIESDPNSGLYGSAINTDPPVFQGKELQIAQDLGRIATPAAPAVKVPAIPAAPPPAPVITNTNAYYLQAGAFRSTQDAESMQARIILLGLNVTVQTGSYEGGTINRVRVGPFSGVDAMNQARLRLSEEKIETSVVRP